MPFSRPHSHTHTLFSVFTPFVFIRSFFHTNQRVTGDKKYTDKFDFSFSPQVGGVGCVLSACSESQVTSVLDYSTNFCNLHALYCSSADGCPTAGTDLSYSESYSSCSQHDAGACIVSKEAFYYKGLRGEEGATTTADDKCPVVTTPPSFDQASYLTGKWWIHQQAETKYLPASQNWCVSAEYLVVSPTFLGYTVQVHNHAEESDGTVHDSGTKICARQEPSPNSDPAKLEVAPCFLPPSLAAGPYWVVAYDETVGYALVSGGQPTVPSTAYPGTCSTGGAETVNGSGLWIFTREQKRDEELVQNIRQIALSKGISIEGLNDVDNTDC